MHLNIQKTTIFQFRTSTKKHNFSESQQAIFESPASKLVFQRMLGQLPFLSPLPFSVLGTEAFDYALPEGTNLEVNNEITTDKILAEMVEIAATTLAMKTTSARTPLIPMDNTLGAYEGFEPSCSTFPFDPIEIAYPDRIPRMELTNSILSLIFKK